MSSKPRPANRAPSSPFAHRNLPLLLLQARDCVLGRFRPILNAHGVTEQQWRILRSLIEATGPLEPRQIGAVCGISSPSMAGILTRMETMGLITRERPGHDQRRVLVSATASSRALATRMAPLIEATYQSLEERLDSAFVERLYKTLDELIATLGVPDDGADEMKS